ncbi:MAG: hypothetical protein KC620_27570, partial [Myxococcales bacterium]|nr:hypothetical protein [Myxococcales bacterium]
LLNLAEQTLVALRRALQLDRMGEDDDFGGPVDPSALAAVLEATRHVVQVSEAAGRALDRLTGIVKQVDARARSSRVVTEMELITFIARIVDFVRERGGRELAAALIQWLQLTARGASGNPGLASPADE